jgi:peroxiredoxin
MPKYNRIEVGDPAPWFRQASTSNPVYNFNTAAGRYLVLCFYGTAADARGAEAMAILTRHRALFDDEKVAFFGISADPQDQIQARVAESLPGIRFIWDFDASVSRLYGAAPVDVQGGTVSLRRFWMIVDPTLRVRVIVPFREDGGDGEEVAAYLTALPPVDRFAGTPLQAPIIFLPNVFEPDLCRQLVDLYESHGGEESGFMREEGGKTVLVTDFGHKRRRDHTIESEELRQLLQRKIIRRIVPEIQKVHQFTVTRMERYIIGCYDATTAGHFRPHRDNTTKGTAHRRFAVSINLNADFEGGEISFPEYGPRSFKPPPGGAVIFSCSLLHAVSPMRAGKRYAFLPFLYDEAAAALREANNKFLDEAVGAYRS